MATIHQNKILYFLSSLVAQGMLLASSYLAPHAKSSLSQEFVGFA